MDSPETVPRYAGRTDLPRERRYTDVETPDGRYRIRTLTNAEICEIKLWLIADDAHWPRVHEMLIAYCWVDQNDQPILSPSEVDLGFFKTVDGGWIRGLGEACDEFVGFNRSAYDVQKVNQTAKNLLLGQAG